jgi:alkylated DNA repair protein alkB family protein 1
MLHRDLSHEAHRTNLHTHYDLSYPPSSSSFFSFPPTSDEIIAHPIDPSVHRPLKTAQVLNKKMRWMTLGGQYDWTRKQYPETPPPPFPNDIKQLLKSAFGDTIAEAAIVNLYSPGDTLSIHRDVAESSATGLISISLGCDALFVIGTSSPTSTSSGVAQDRILTLRLRSGSAVYMSGPSRFAWHGVPQIISGTCPAYLESWPASDNNNSEGEEYEAWRGWMKNKRVNLNVRQMWD